MARTDKGIETVNGARRCWWCGSDEGYQAYHDREWGFPVRDDRRIYEKICLEGFQSGLSWLTILRKRENFRRAFAGFDFEKVARFNRRSVERLLKDAGIVRHRGKIESAINNAKRACELIEACGSLAGFVWSFEPDPGDRPKRLDKATLMTLAKTPESTALSKALKARGWTYVGPTSMYAMMQSIGVVNDHLEGCDARAAAVEARARFRVPQTRSG